MSWCLHTPPGCVHLTLSSERSSSHHRKSSSPRLAWILLLLLCKCVSHMFSIKRNSKQIKTNLSGISSKRGCFFDGGVNVMPGVSLCAWSERRNPRRASSPCCVDPIQAPSSAAFRWRARRGLSRSTRSPGTTAGRAVVRRIRDSSSAGTESHIRRKHVFFNLAR